VSTGEVVGRINAMACDIAVLAHASRVDPAILRRRVDASLDIFNVVNVLCTRFDATSPLMRANAAPEQWTHVPPMCFEAIREAHRAYVLTAGRFDPRVLDDLVRLGYGRSMSAGVPLEVDAPHALDQRQPLPQWAPQFRVDSSEVLLGSVPIDLGGIGKGLAVRWCSDRLRHGAEGVVDYLVEAGGDCFCAGRAPEGGPWRLSVEDPAGGSTPVAVLELTDLACATSSVRIRQWRAAGQLVHHLIDPRTGLPGGHGLRSVTVIDGDPATAEVWSKTLFLSGRGGIAEAANTQRLCALWVDDGGGIQMSRAMAPYVIWQSS
jgi:thiamine biosynthesis lipoprotein